jgi:UDP-galactopyranose mutase
LHTCRNLPGGDITSTGSSRECGGDSFPFPINLDTVNQLYELELDSAGLRRFLEARSISCLEIRTSEDAVLSSLGRELYELFFFNYTLKQWGRAPSALDASVAGRVAVRFDREDRYFTDRFQGLPSEGYRAMFERMLDHPLITVRTGLDFCEVKGCHPGSRVVYTGSIDEYYGFVFGRLPYRSLHFRHLTCKTPVFQPAPVINYPNDFDYTRITEFKYLTGQHHESTAVAYEYPRAEGEPYYPVPCKENSLIYSQYAKLSEQDQRVVFCGRLATYKYMNMDQVVAQALRTFRKIAYQ